MNKPKIEEILNIDPKHLNAYSTGLLQGKAYNRLHTQLTRTLSPYDLSIPEWKLLGQLYENDKINLSELADLLSYDPPMVTKLAKLLEKKGHITRTADNKDERVKTIAITASGKKLIVTIEPVAKKAIGLMLTGVTQKELLTYIKVLGMIVNNTQ